MVSATGLHMRSNGIKQYPARVVVSLNGVGLGGDEQHPDTITVLRDTRVFPNGETAPDFHTFQPGAVTWEQYGRYWFKERTENGGNFRAAWDKNPTHYRIIQNEQGGNDPWAIQRMVDIERAISWAAGADGYKCCVGNLAGGTPGDFELWRSIIAPFIIEAWEMWGHVYGRHVYGQADKDVAGKDIPGTGDLVLPDGTPKPGQPARVIQELEYLQAAGYGGGVILTECGLEEGYGVVDYGRFEQQVLGWEAALRPYAESGLLIGLCWWETGGSEFNADYTAHLKQIEPKLYKGLPKWTPPEVEEPMEPKECDLYLDLGRFVHLLPQDTTDEEIAAVARQFNAAKNSFVYSHDDAELIVAHGRGENTEGKKVSEVRIWNPERFADDVVDYFASRGYKYSVDYFAGAPDPELEIFDIVDQLPKHATLKYATRPLTAVTTLTIHHTVSPPDRSIESIAAFHVNERGWPGIAYHFVLKDDGRIFQTNHLETKSYHAGSDAPGDENLISVGIALQGDFTSSPPPQAQQDAARALVAHLLDTLPNATAVLGHKAMPGAQTQCPGNTSAQWLPYVAGGVAQPAPPPPPPPVQLVDMTQYYLPPNGRTYGDISIKPTNWGQGDVRQQLQLHGGYLFVTKGGEFEKRMILDGRIYFLMDDSPGNGKYYKVNSPTGWIPTQMAVGQTFTRQETTTFYFKTNCQPTGEVSNWSNAMLFKAFFPEWTSPHGIKLANVAHLQWLVNGAVEEDYYLAPGLGYAGWKNRHGRESWIKELIPYTDQQPNKIAGSCYHEAFG